MKLIVAVLLCCTLTTSAQVPEHPAAVRLNGERVSSAQVDETVERLMKAAKVPGVGIAFFTAGHLSYLKAYGYRDTERKLPLTVNTVMTSASLTKAAFATMVVQLAQDRQIDLDRPITKYLSKDLSQYPRYADLAGDDSYKSLTLRILLSHTSGFPNFRRFDGGKLQIHFKPGSRFAYSGEGMELAQFVAETATGKSIRELMQQRVFSPLQMERTSMTWEPRFETDYANGYDERGQSLGPQRRTRADVAGSMQTSLSDYAVFLQGLLLGRVLRPAFEDSMLTPQISIHSRHQFPSLSPETTTDNDGIRLSYGLGWGLYTTPYGMAFFKEGHDDGWRHYTVCFRKNGTGLLIMTNSANAEGIYQPLLESLMGNSYTPLEWEGFLPYTKAPTP